MPARPAAKPPAFNHDELRGLARLAADPALFRQVLVVPTADKGPQLLADVAAPFQREWLAAMDPALLALANGQKPPIGRYLWCATKGAGKDFLLAVAVLWLIAFSRRQIRGQAGAADAEQADELRKSAKEILKLNPWLAKLVTITGWEIENPATESALEIIPADVAGSHGARPNLLIVNELSAITKREFVDNLLDNAGKVPHGLVCLATNAGEIETWQHEYYLEAQRSPLWSFHELCEPSPWISQDFLAERERMTPPRRFRRLWHGEWSDGEGDALTRDCILAAVNPKLAPMRGDEEGFCFLGAIDLGISQDHSAFVVAGKSVSFVRQIERVTADYARPHVFDVMADLGILDDGDGGIDSPHPAGPEPRYDYIEHEGTGRVRLAWCESWRPPGNGGKIDLMQVEAAVLQAHRRFNLAGVWFDPYQCELMAQRLTRAGVPMHPMPFRGATLDAMASTLLEAFQSRLIELYPEAGELVADLQRLRIIEKPYGVRLDSSRTADGGHADRATALAIALLAARSVHAGPAARVDGPLVCWP